MARREEDASIAMKTWIGAVTGSAWVTIVKRRQPSRQPDVAAIVKSAGVVHSRRVSAAANKRHIGFDQNLAELRRALQLARPHYAACAVIVSFGGVLRLVMLQALRMIGFLAGESPPMHLCSTAVEAVCWMEPYATSSTVATFDPLYYMEALQEMELLLGSAE